MESVSCERPLYLMMVGLPGCGKSTYYTNKLGKFDPFLYSSDAEVEILAAQAGVTYSEAFASSINAATRLAEAGRAAALAEGRNIVDDHTNLTVKTRARRLKDVPAKYMKTAFVFEVETAELNRRRALRVGKTIPKNVLHSMAQTYVIPMLSEGFDAVVYVTSAGVAQ